MNENCGDLKSNEAPRIRRALGSKYFSDKKIPNNERDAVTGAMRPGAIFQTLTKPVAIAGANPPKVATDMLYPNDIAVTLFSGGNLS